MPCNCGSTETTVREWVYTHPVTGTTTTYKSEVEAMAAKLRNEGGSIQLSEKVRT